MPYVPPKYPGQIPTAEDLPDRDDDVDWLYAARYNELKKELRAALIELGTLPKGGYADVKTRLDDLAGGFTDRGDPGVKDFGIGDFTTNDAWHDLDLSGIVPAGAKAVALSVLIKDNAINSTFLLRKNGNTGGVNVSKMRTQVANLFHDGDCIVALDSNRIIEYYATSTVWTGIDITVKGWWK